MGALKDVRALDLGTFLAGPYCATVLAEFGAEVIKVEPPDGGDALRQFGTPTDVGDTLVWMSESRNKKCITLNLRTGQGIELLKRLVEKCDIVIENFRPGVLEKWGLGWEGIQAINPRAILVRISAYGQTGPYRARPGFARVAHAFSGLAYLAGEPGRVPVVPGSTSLADYLSGVYGALGALMALHARNSTGKGQCVDLGLYEPIFRVLDELVPAYHQAGVVRERMGPDTVNVCPHSHYRTRDDKWIAIACSSDAMFERLARAMGRSQLAQSDAYGPKHRRLAARDEVNRVVQDWVGSLDCEEVLRRCEESGTPASLIYSIADIFEDPQYRARDNVQVHQSRIGPLAVPAVVPRLSETPGAINWLGERLGAHNEEVLCGLLGLSASEMQELHAKGVV